MIEKKSTLLYALKHYIQNGFSLIAFPIVMMVLFSPVLVYLLHLMPEVFVIWFSKITIAYFVIVFIISVFVGRAYCSKLCPVTKFFLIVSRVTKNKNMLDSKYPKYVAVFFNSIWVIGFVYLMISLYFQKSDSVYHHPVVIVFYLLLFTASFLCMLLIKNEDNHPICPLIPYIQAGVNISRKLKIPHLQLLSYPNNCKNCKVCEGSCIAKLEISALAKNNELMGSQKCYNCGICASKCRFGALEYKFIRSVSNE